MSFVKRGYGNVFFQIDPTLVYQYLTSTGVGDVNTPGRPRTIKYDPDVMRSGEFVASEFVRGEPGETTAPFTRPLDTVANYLQELKCSINARINWACRGDRNIVWNYELAMILLGSEFEGGSTGQPAITQPSEEDRVMTGGDLKALLWTYLYLLTGGTQTVAGTAVINDIIFLPEECGDRCGDRVKLGCLGYTAQETLGYLLGDNVLFTDECGADWAATTNDPFLGSKSGTAVLTVETSTGHRIIVAGGAEVGVPAEVSYSDDEGVTWNDVTVGAINGQSINALCRDKRGRIWAAASGGYVYVSTDLAMSWAASHSAVETTEDLNGICFVDEYAGFAVGDANAVIYTPDAGDTWEALTGPAAAINLTSVDYNRYNYIFASTADGSVWRSSNAGETWVEVLSMGAGSVARVRFDEYFRYFGGVVWNNAAGAGTFMRSEDGGVSFQAWDTPTNTGLRSLYMCDPNMAYVCGDDAFIAKFVRAAT